MINSRLPHSEVYGASGPQQLFTWKKRKRLSGGRKALAILAGFRKSDGVVLCADTQETNDPAKRTVTKLRFQESKGPDMALAICGAGHGPFTDKITEGCWADIQLSSNLDDACEELEKGIKKMYRDFGRIYQPGRCPEVELLYAVKMHGNSRMFHAYGPVVNEKLQYQACGSGEYLADFLAMRMLTDTLSLKQVIILAAYILFQAKEHVDGCGGDSHIVVLRNDGKSGRVHASAVERITQILQNVDSQAGSAVLTAADLSLTPRKLRAELKRSMKNMELFHSNGIQQVRQSKELIHALRDNPWFSAIFGHAILDEFGIEKKFKVNTKQVKEMFK